MNYHCTCTIGPCFIPVSGAIMSPHGHKKILMMRNKLSHCSGLKIRTEGRASKSRCPSHRISDVIGGL